MSLNKKLKKHQTITELAKDLSKTLPNFAIELIAGELLLVETYRGQKVGAGIINPASATGHSITIFRDYVCQILLENFLKENGFKVNTAPWPMKPIIIN